MGKTLAEKVWDAHVVRSAPGEPDLERITVTPRQGTYRRGESLGLRVEARYSDGSTRDVTKLAAFAPSDPEVAAVDEDGRVRVRIEVAAS